jgi:hypothetical protein
MIICCNDVQHKQSMKTYIRTKLFLKDKSLRYFVCFSSIRFGTLALPALVRDAPTCSWRSKDLQLYYLPLVPSLASGLTAALWHLRNMSSLSQRLYRNMHSKAHLPSWTSMQRNLPVTCSLSTCVHLLPQILKASLRLYSSTEPSNLGPRWTRSGTSSYFQQISLTLIRLVMCGRRCCRFHPTNIQPPSF